MHKLLERQLKRHLGNPDDVPERMRAFVAAVDEAYRQHDEDRALLEHSMDTVSGELLERFRRLQEEEARYRELLDHKRRSDGLALMHGLMVWANDAPDTPSALAAVTTQICAHTGWRAAEAWLPDASQEFIRRVAVHDADPGRYAFLSDGAAVCHRTDDALPGRAWCSASPHWCHCASPEPTYARCAAAARDGLGAGVAIPVVSDGAVLAVLVFYLESITEADEYYVRLVTVLAVQLGSVIRRKEAELAVRQALAEARAASDAKREFLARMSHELRTPLNSVIGFSNVLLRNRSGALAGQDLEFLRRIHANGRHLLSLINDILDLAKIEAGRMDVAAAPVDVASLALETMAQLESQARPGVVLAAEMPAGSAVVVTDAAKLKQVLINLIGNALKFTESGRVTVVVELAPDSRRPVAIVVRDTGIGIRADRIPRIFDAFEQGDSGTARRFGGTGLGLAISRSICELLGLSLTVESAEGVGSMFRVGFRPTEASTPAASYVALEARV